MSGTIARVSSGILLRQQRPFNLRLRPNYATKPQDEAKRTVKRAVKKVKYQFNKLTAGKSTRQEKAGWVLVGIVGLCLVKKILF